MEQEQRGISRRDLLKSGAIAGAGVALSGLFGCKSPTSSETEPTWDEEVDFVVAGAGTGLLGAMAARKEGKTVVLLEKGTRVGGTMMISDGGMWVPLNHLRDAATWGEDTPEMAAEYMMASDTWGTGVEANIKDYAARVGKVFEYVIKTLGLPLVNVPIIDYNSFPGATSGRTLGILDQSGGMTGIKAWNETLGPIVEQLGIDTRLGTEVTALHTDAQGAVIGVTAMSGNKEVKIKANKGVLLATGGFDRNAAMRKEYLRGGLDATVAVPGDTGDGHRLGMALGADVAAMSSIFMANAYLTDGEELTGVFEYLHYRLQPNSIIVNSKGRRFFNESTSYDGAGWAVAGVDVTGGTPLALNRNSFHICDARFVQDYGLPGVGKDKPQPEWIHSYNSIEELAEGEGIVPDQLVKEVARFNGFCEVGIDDDFHRGEGNFTVANGVGGAHHVPRTDLKNNYLGPVSTAPFYAVKIGIGSFGTQGGLVVNENAQVLKDGTPIPGLYAAGCTSASIVSGYPGAGTAIATGIFRSIVAVNHAMQLGIA